MLRPVLEQAWAKPRSTKQSRDGLAVDYLYGYCSIFEVAAGIVGQKAGPAVCLLRRPAAEE